MLPAPLNMPLDVNGLQRRAGLNTRPHSANQLRRSTTHRATAYWQKWPSSINVTRQPGWEGQNSRLGCWSECECESENSPQVPRRLQGTLPRKVPSPQSQLLWKTEREPKPTLTKPEKC
ncbi:hypothetical protein HispidOSU_021861, partial [Sigmodon hispidus]